jgi:glycosyltransferase involved in cell wall biosynthesis
MGWLVTVLTTGCVKRVPRLNPHGLAIRYVRGLRFRRKPIWYRALSYLSLYPAFLWGFLKIGQLDVIVVMTDPPLFLSVAVLYAKWKGIPVVHWSQDLYPELAFAVGVLKRNSILGRALTRIRDKAIRRCTVIVVIGRCMAAQLAKRTPCAIRIIPNWADGDAIVPLPHDANPFRAKLLAGVYEQIVMYSGNFGIAHPFGAILDAMTELEFRRPKVRFAMIGDGPRLADLQSEVAERGLGNVIFLPPQPYSDLAATLGAADVQLACMETEMLGLVVPSKVYGILAAGRPCIFIGPAESEAALLVDESSAGEVLPPGTEHQLGARLRAWLDNTEARDKTGRNARKAAEKASLSNAADQFAAVLRYVTNLDKH